jgi:protein phosphatase
MGGHNAGEVASAMAVEIFAGCMRASEKLNATAIHSAVRRANEVVYEESLRNENRSGMGTTFTALCVDGNVMHIAHVGDSRAYRIGSDEFMRVTNDHTLVEELVQRGVISAKMARVHPQRNVVTRALGADQTVEIDLIQMEVSESDVMLLCSDGLSNHVDEKEMEAITRSGMSWEDKLRTLVSRALDDGGTDNITAMYVTFEEEHK